MITCDEALELLSAALDAPLSGGEQEALSGHLAVCPECRALQADFAAMHEAMGDWETVSPPPELADQVMEKVRASKITPLPRIKRVWRAWAGVAAVCALALLGAGPLRLWLSPNSLTGGGATAGAPMSAQAEPFDAMPASLPQESASPDLTLKTSGAEAGMKAAPIPSLLPGGDGGSYTPSGQYTPVPQDAPASQDTLTSQENYTSAPSGSMQEIPTRTDAVTDGGSCAPGGGNAVTAPQSTTPPEGGDTQTPSTGLLTAPRTASVAIYCGILTLPYDKAPDLSAYHYSQSGNRRFYIVPVEDFAALLETCKDVEGAEVNPEGEALSPNAPEGLLILTQAPSE